MTKLLRLKVKSVGKIFRCKILCRTECIKKEKIRQIFARVNVALQFCAKRNIKKTAALQGIHILPSILTLDVIILESYNFLAHQFAVEIRSLPEQLEK